MEVEGAPPIVWSSDLWTAPGSHGQLDSAWAAGGDESEGAHLIRKKAIDPASQKKKM